MNSAALALLPVAAALVFPAQDGAALPWRLPDEGWRTDRVWYDGQAEKCVYEATRTIYGVERRYLATAYTNKQHMDPGTTTKSANPGGRGGVEVFKHHWSERVPTENYDYDFSTASFVRTDDLGPFKLTASTQEDCGASFKQVWRAGRRLAWLESVYFPGAGLREGRIGRLDVCFEDALPLVLRDYPFDGDEEGAEGKGGGRRRLRVVPSQKSTHSVPFEPVTMELVPRGPETLELPVGSVDAFRLDLVAEGGERPRASFWFARDGLHPLVRYEGPEGVTYRLRSVERTAYWERDS
jgi:hypothetical protein